MKTLHGPTKCGLFVIAAFCLSSSECDRKHNVLFVPNYEKADMVILPATEITEEDAAHLRKILKASNEYFYTIQPYENGSPVAALGKLPLPTDFKCRTDKGEFEGFTPGTSRKFTRWTGFTPGTSRTFTRWTRVVGLGCQSRCLMHTRMSTKSSQDLVDAVKPILLKYQVP